MSDRIEGTSVRQILQNMIGTYAKSKVSHRCYKMSYKREALNRHQHAIKCHAYATQRKKLLLFIYLFIYFLSYFILIMTIRTILIT